jgi:hypothetical protein
MHRTNDSYTRWGQRPQKYPPQKPKYEPLSYILESQLIGLTTSHVEKFPVTTTHVKISPCILAGLSTIYASLCQMLDQPQNTQSEPVYVLLPVYCKNNVFEDTQLAVTGSLYDVESDNPRDGCNRELEEELGVTIADTTSVISFPTTVDKNKHINNFAVSAEYLRIFQDVEQSRPEQPRPENAPTTQNEQPHPENTPTTQNEHPRSENSPAPKPKELHNLKIQVVVYGTYEQLMTFVTREFIKRRPAPDNQFSATKFWIGGMRICKLHDVKEILENISQSQKHNL